MHALPACALLLFSLSCLPLLRTMLRCCVSVFLPIIKMSKVMFEEERGETDIGRMQCWRKLESLRWQAGKREREMTHATVLPHLPLKRGCRLSRLPLQAGHASCL